MFMREKLVQELKSVICIMFVQLPLCSQMPLVSAFQACGPLKTLKSINTHINAFEHCQKWCLHDDPCVNQHLSKTTFLRPLADPDLFSIKSCANQTAQKQNPSAGSRAMKTWSPRLTVNLGHRGVRLVEKVPPVLRALPAGFLKRLKVLKLALIDFCRLFSASKNWSWRHHVHEKKNHSEIEICDLHRACSGSKMPPVKVFQACRP